MAAEDTPVTGQNPLPPSQWVTGIGAGGLTPGSEADDQADTGSITRLPKKNEDPGTAVTRIEPHGFENAPTQLEVGATRIEGGGARPAELDATAPPSPRPPVRPPVEETLPPSAKKQAPVEREEEVRTLPPGHVRAARRGRWLLVLAVLLIPAAFFGGRVLRTRLLPAPGQPEIALESPAPGAWAEGAVQVKGVAQGLVEGTAAIGTQQVALGPAGQFELLVSGPDGVHTWMLVARGRDAAGKPAEAKRPVVLRFDRTPPVVAVLDPLEGSEVPAGPVRIRFSAVDAAGVQVTVRLNGAALPLPDGSSKERIVELSTAPLAPGTYELRVLAMDPAGHPGGDARRFRVVEKPPVDPGTGPRPPAPTVSISWPPDGLLGRTGLEVRSGNASDVSVLLDGVRVASATPWRLDPAGVKDGVHTLEVVARGPGGSARESRRFTRDTTAPELEVTFASGPSPLAVTGRVVDAIDPRPGLELEIDGGRPVPLSGLPAQVSLPPGPHTLVVWAEDLAGNRAQRRGAVVVEAPPAKVDPPPAKVDPPPTNVDPPPTKVDPPPVKVDPPPVKVDPPPTKVDPPPLVSVQVRLPARSRGRVRIEATEPPPAGTEATVDVLGSRLASGPLPLEITLGPGRHLVAITVRVPKAAPQKQEGWVEVDIQPPAIGALRAQPNGPELTRITAEVKEAGALALELLLDGEAVANALPVDLRLTAGDHELVLVARDEVGNEARKVLVVRGPEAVTPPTPAEAPWPTDSGDPREEEAARLFAAGKRREARDVINGLIESGQRGLRSPYVLRARLRLEYGKSLTDDERRRRSLNNGLGDIRHAIVNYGSQVEARHYELEAQLLEALGRPTQAAESRARARALGR